MEMENSHTLSGEVEIDEAFVGGKNKNRHKDKKVEKCQGRSYKDKVPVFGILERGGKVIAKVVPNTQAKTIVPIIKEKVELGSVVYTDGWDYSGLHGKYVQRSVDHEKHFYGTTYATDEGEIIVVSTNGIENVWSHFKRMIFGIYYHVSKNICRGILTNIFSDLILEILPILKDLIYFCVMQLSYGKEKETRNRPK